MSQPRNALLGHSRDLLSHTLAHAGSTVDHRTARLNSDVVIEGLANGIILIQPPLPPKKQLIVSAGVHGNETAPIEVLNLLVEELLDEVWTPELAILLILGNPEAMVAGSRFLDFNMNRLFLGTHSQPPYAGSRDAERAAEIEHWVAHFVQPGIPLVHYDLHTAIRPSKRERFALYPFVPERSVPGEQIDFLLESDVQTLLLQHKRATTFASHTALTFDAESFTIELGKVMPFGQNDLNRFTGIRDSLRRLMQGLGPQPTLDHSDMTLFEVVHEIIHTGEGFRFHVPDDVANFTEYPPGTVIWEDGEDAYRVGERPEVIVFPNRQVPPGQRVGLMARVRR